MVLGAIFQKREHYPECSSTNSILADRINNYQDPKKLSGLYITASFQTAGRGQGTHRWYTTAGKNLLLSFLSIPNTIHPEQQFAISRLTALGIVSMLHSLLPENQMIRIKWPNDIYVNERKIAGTLIENRIAGSTLATSIIGCGLNVNEQTFPKSIPNPISIQQISGYDIPVEEALKMFIESMLKINLTYDHTTLVSIHSAYDCLLFGKGEDMFFEDKEGVFQGAIQGTTPTGLLIIQTEHGSRQYAFQEVKYHRTKPTS